MTAVRIIFIPPKSLKLWKNKTYPQAHSGLWVFLYSKMKRRRKCFFAFVAGILFGLIFMKRVLNKAKIGTLRVDTSDPEDRPYLFLELEKNVGYISSKSYVLLKVNTQSYLSRK